MLKLHRNTFFFLAILSIASFVAIAQEEEITSEGRPTYAIGHLVPDTDTIAGAIAAAYLFDAIPARTGEINAETKFVLDYFNVDEPKLVSDFKGSNVIIVDFNQKTQAPEGFNGRVIRIIDHHALQDAALTTQEPINIEIRPWGSVCTIIAKNYFVKKQRIIPKKIAGLLFGAILSDTLNLRSPTTTRHDHEMVTHLAHVAGVSDIDGFATKMFKIKSDISGKKAEEIISGDLKEFSIGGKKIAIGVTETLYPENVFARKEELLTAARGIKKEKKFDLFFFFVVNIHDRDSQLFIVGPDEQKVAEKAFDAKGKTKNDVLYAGGRISRKLQIVPDLSKVLEP